MLGYINEARDTGKYDNEADVMDAAFDMHIAKLG
jgi:hypothetical protein